MNDRIGELLVQKNLLSEEQLKRAKEEARASGTRIGYQITKLGFVEEEKVAEAVSTQYGVPTVALHTDIFDRVVTSTARVQGLAVRNEDSDGILTIHGPMIHDSAVLRSTFIPPSARPARRSAPRLA